MFGISASEALGCKFLDVIDTVERYPGETEEITQKLHVQGFLQAEQHYRTKKGDLWVDVHVQDIVSNGSRYGMVILASDITERRHAGDAIR